MKIKIIQSTVCDTVNVYADEIIDTTKSQARLLVRLGKAVPVVAPAPEPEVPDAPEPEVPDAPIPTPPKRGKRSNK